MMSFTNPKSLVRFGMLPAIVAHEFTHYLIGKIALSKVRIHPHKPTLQIPINESYRTVLAALSPFLTIGPIAVFSYFSFPDTIVHKVILIWLIYASIPSGRDLNCASEAMSDEKNAYKRLVGKIFEYLSLVYQYSIVSPSVTAAFFSILVVVLFF